MAMDRSYSEEGEWIFGKTNIGIEFAGSQKERKIAVNLEKGSFGGSNTTTTTTTPSTTTTTTINIITTTTTTTTTNCLYMTISNSVEND